MNCWEFKKCGRQKGGTRVEEFGECPAYPKHGQHCAWVAGTFCGGKIQGTFAMKFANCLKCDFYLSSHYDKTYNPARKADSSKNVPQNPFS